MSRGQVLPGIFRAPSIGPTLVPFHPQPVLRACSIRLRAADDEKRSLRANQRSEVEEALF